MENFVLFFIVVLSYKINNCFCANILVLEEIPMGSHHSWIRTISYELAARGHNVTSLSNLVEENSPVHYLHLDKIIRYEFININTASSLSMITGLNGYAVQACKDSSVSIGWKQLLNYPNDFKFDLIIFDYILGGCQLAFADKFNYPPILGTSSAKEITLTLKLLGYPLLPSINTFFAMNHFGSGIVHAVQNYISQIEHYVLNEFYYQPKLDDIVRESFPNITALDMVYKKMRIILLNNHPVPEKALYPSHIIQVSGLHITRVKSLPKDLDDVMKSAIDGVILFSIGSYLRIDMIDDSLLQHIISTFESFPNYNFIWQFNGERDLPKNVFKFKWIPQNDILGHEKTKLFISHCGLLSVQEAVYHGVPILGTPISNEQFMNSELLVKSGAAEQISLVNLTSAMFSEKIFKILNAPNYYHENMRKISKVFRDQKDEPLERAMWWIEWLIRNPNITAEHNPLQNFNFMQRQSLDVLIIIEILIAFILLILYLILRKCYKSTHIFKRNIEKNGKLE